MKKITLLFALIFVTLLQAQNQAAIDMSFNHRDDLPMFNLNIEQTITQPDGKILAIGGFTMYFNYNISYESYIDNVCSRIVRLNTDLTIDPTFNTGLGFITVGSGTDFEVVKTMALQSDGKILVGGRFTSYNGSPIAKIIRLNSDGSIDNSFSNSEIFVSGGFVSNIKIQPVNKIIVAGAMLNSSGNGLVRLNADGSVDDSFTNPTSFTGQFNGFDTIHLLPDGKILAGGSVGVARKLYLLNGDGSLDTTFNMGFSNLISVIVQPDNKILIVQEGSSIADDAIIRLNSNGTVDPTFNIGTGFKLTANLGFIGGIDLQPNGDIIVCGLFDKYNEIAVKNRVRLNSNGMFDPTFNNQNIDSNDRLTYVQSQPDGSILASLYINSPDFVIRYCFTRLDANGYISENKHLITATKVNKIVKKSNTEIMAIGSSDFSFNFYHNGIKLLDQNGDLVYNDNLKAPLNANNIVSTAKVQPDGKVLFIGKLPQNPTGILMRFNADFSNDSSFNLDASLTSLTFKELNLQSDGKILVSAKGLVMGNNINRVIRLNSDGSIDASFSVGQGCSGLTAEIRAIEIQSDGKILISGTFTAYNGVIKNGIVRLNTDGTIDSGFNMPNIDFFARTVDAMSIQSDGKIIVGVPGVGIYRLNTNGSLDTSFLSPINNGRFNTIVIQADGKILIGGILSLGNENPNFLKLNSNGSVDTTFDTGTGFNDEVNSILIEDDGRILVGGNFTRYNGEKCSGVIRLNGTATLSTTQNEFDSRYFTVSPNPVSDVLNIVKKEGVGINTVEIFNLLGQSIDKITDAEKTNMIDVSHFKSGTYILKINSDKGISNSKFIKL